MNKRRIKNQNYKKFNVDLFKMNIRIPCCEDKTAMAILESIQLRETPEQI